MKTHFVALLLAVVLLAGCGFRPLYSSESVDERAAAIDIAPIDGKLGQGLRVRLEDRFNPGGAAVPKEYRLVITLKEREVSSQAIRRDDTATRYTIELRADYVMYREGEAVLRDNAKYRAAYNILSDPYASHVSHQDALDRLNDLLAGDIAVRVSLYLKDHK